MMLGLLAVSLAVVLGHSSGGAVGNSTPALAGLLSDTGQCPEGCECSDGVRYVVCEYVDPYLVLEELSGLVVESLVLGECLLPDMYQNETALDLTFGYLTTLRLDECDLNSTLVNGFDVFTRLTSLELSGGSSQELSVSCDALEHLSNVYIVNSSLHHNPISNCDTSSLRNLNLSENKLVEFNLQDLVYFYNIENLDLSGNSLKVLRPAQSPVSLKSLNLHNNPGLTSVCTSVLRVLPNLQFLDISYTGVYQVPLGLLEHGSLETLEVEGVNLLCDCQTTLRLNSLRPSKLFQHRHQGLSCTSPVSGTRFDMADINILDSLNCGDNLTENEVPTREHFAGETVYVDCPLVGDLTSGYEVLWLSPRLDLVRWLPEPQSCPSTSQDIFQLAPTTNDYSYWMNHYTVMRNGSLRIDMFGWRDRGPFICYADNGIFNASSSVYLKLNYHYRNKLYYLSLAWGFGAAACFLGLTLLGKLLQFLLWNYGCCLCCSCCKDQQPPKIKKLTKVVDSIETYRIQQLEKLRENYNLQSLRIRDNCVMQMEKVRENYHTQVKSLKEMKNYGSAQYSGMKDQYADQISKIREYSSGQLDKCHENYIFQRQRLRKFSAQNYLRIRETKQYTQKTLNRVLENMPALYLDLSSCKQGIGDQDLREWQEEMDRREAEMKDILNTDKALELGDLGDSQSLYFTPDGTPFRDLSSSAKGTPMRDEAGRTIYSPSRSPEKTGGKRGHKRMVSNLSSLFPFWWGVSQSQEVETVAIVEPRRPEDDASDVAAPEQDQDNCEQSVPLISPRSDPGVTEHCVPLLSPRSDPGVVEHCVPLKLDRSHHDRSDDRCEHSLPLLSASVEHGLEQGHLQLEDLAELRQIDAMSEFTLELKTEDTPVCPPPGDTSPLQPPGDRNKMKALSQSVSVLDDETLATDAAAGSICSTKNLHSSNSLPTLTGETVDPGDDGGGDGDDSLHLLTSADQAGDKTDVVMTAPPQQLEPGLSPTSIKLTVGPLASVNDDSFLPGELAAEESVTESSITDSGINCGDDDEVTRLDYPSMEAVATAYEHEKDILDGVLHHHVEKRPSADNILTTTHEQ